MADFQKIRRRSLGSPPSIEEASQNLQAPEVAPVARDPAPSVQETATSAPLQLLATAVEQSRARRDGRTLRRTNRTIAFATRVSADFDNRIRDIAERDGLKLVEILERALDAYEHSRQKG